MIAKVAVIGTVRFPPEKIAEVLPHLKILVDTTYKVDGCLAFDVAEDPFDRGLIRFSELWPDHESLEKHLKAPHMEPWFKAVNEWVKAREFMIYDIGNGKKL